MALEMVGNIIFAATAIYSAAKQARENEEEFEELIELVQSVARFIERYETEFLELSQRYEVDTTLRRLDLTMKKIRHHVDKVLDKNTTLWNWYKADEYGKRQKSFKNDLSMYLQNLSTFVLTGASVGKGRSRGKSSEPRPSLSHQATATALQLSTAVEDALAALSGQISEAFLKAAPEKRMQSTKLAEQVQERQKKLLERFDDPSRSLTQADYIRDVAQQMAMIATSLDLVDDDEQNPFSPRTPGSPAPDGVMNLEQRKHLSSAFYTQFIEKWGAAFEQATAEMLKNELTKDDIHATLLERVAKIMDSLQPLEDRLQQLVVLQERVENAIIAQIAKNYKDRVTKTNDEYQSEIQKLKESLQNQKSQSKDGSPSSSSDAAGGTGGASPSASGEDNELIENANRREAELTALKDEVFKVLEQSTEIEASTYTKYKAMETASSRTESTMQELFERSKVELEEALSKLRSQIAQDTKEIVTAVVSEAQAAIVEEVKGSLEVQTEALVANQDQNTAKITSGIDELKDEVIKLRRQLLDGVNPLSWDDCYKLIPDVKTELIKYYSSIYDTISIMRRNAAQEVDLVFEEIFQMTHASDHDRTCRSIEQWIQRADEIHHSDATCCRWSTLLVEGQAGMGKSSMCKYIARKQCVPEGRVALLVDLPRLKAEVEAKKLSAGDSIDRNMCMNVALSSWKSKHSAGVVGYELNHVKAVLQQQNIMWLLDGFDEVSGVTNKTTQDLFQQLINSCFEKESGFRHGHDVVLITTRRERQDSIAFNQKRESSVLPLELKKWSRFDIYRYVEHFFDSYEKANPHRLWVPAARNAVRRATSLPTLRLWDGVPLCYDILCCWACDVFSSGSVEMPRVSPDSILEFAIAETFARETKKGYDRPLVSLTAAKRGAEEVAKRILSAAFTEMDPDGDDVQFTLTKTGWFVLVGQENLQDRDEDDSKAKRAGRGGSRNCYRFAHRSFGEFFVARSLFRLLSVPEAAKVEISVTKGSQVTLSLLAHMLCTEQLHYRADPDRYRGKEDLVTDREGKFIDSKAMGLNLNAKIVTLLSIVQGEFESNYRMKRWEIARALSSPTGNDYATRERWRQETGVNVVVEVCDVLGDFQFCEIRGSRLLWYHALLLEPICRVGRMNSALTVIKRMSANQLTKELKSQALLQVQELLARNGEAELEKGTSGESRTNTSSLLKDWVDCGPFGAKSEAEELSNHLRSIGAEYNLVQACTSGCYRVIDRLLRGDCFEVSELRQAMKASILADEPDCVDSIVHAMVECHGSVFVGRGTASKNAAGLRFRRALLSQPHLTLSNWEGLDALMKLPTETKLQCKTLDCHEVTGYIDEATLSRLLGMAPNIQCLLLSRLAPPLHTFVPIQDAKHRFNQLREIDISHCGIPISDKGLSTLFAKTATLESLDISYCYGDHGDEALMALGKFCGKLTTLRVSGAGNAFTVAGLTAVLQGCPDFVHLAVDGCHGIDGAGALMAIADHRPTLKYLDLSGSVSITDEAMTYASLSMEQLRVLKLKGTAGFVTDAGIVSMIQRNRQLNTLDLGDTEGAITNKTLLAIAQSCSRLQTLSLAGITSGISDEGLQPVFNMCAEINDLDVSRTEGCITDASLEVGIKNCPITSLNVSYTGGAITDSSIKLLAMLCPMSLYELNISYTGNITDSAIGLLALHCRRLQVLKVSAKGSNMTSSCLHDILDANPRLRVLDASGCGATQSLFTDVFNASNGVSRGRWLQVVRATADTHMKDRHIISLSLNCRFLRELSVRKTLGNITDAAIMSVANECAWLETLDVSYTNAAITNTSLTQIIRKCTKLRSLDVSGTQGGVTDKLLILLGKECTRLRVFKACDMGNTQVIASPRYFARRTGGDGSSSEEDSPRFNTGGNPAATHGAITNRGLSALAEGCIGLQVVHLNGNPSIGNEGVQSLGQHCRGLREVLIADTLVSDSGIASIATRCEKLEVFDISGNRCSSAALVSLTACRNLKQLKVERVTEVDVSALEGALGTVPLTELFVDDCLKEKLSLAFVDCRKACRCRIGQRVRAQPLVAARSMATASSPISGSGDGPSKNPPTKKSNSCRWLANLFGAKSK